MVILVPKFKQQLSSFGQFGEHVLFPNHLQIFFTSFFAKKQKQVGILLVFPSTQAGT
jgi:hypothetical protein